MNSHISLPGSYSEISNQVIECDGGKLSTGAIVGITCACVGALVLGGLARGYYLYKQAPDGIQTLGSIKVGRANSAFPKGSRVQFGGDVTFTNPPQLACEEGCEWHRVFTEGPEPKIWGWEVGPKYLED